MEIERGSVTAISRCVTLPVRRAPVLGLLVVDPGGLPLAVPVLAEEPLVRFSVLALAFTELHLLAADLAVRGIGLRRRCRCIKSVAAAGAVRRTRFTASLDDLPDGLMGLVEDLHGGGSVQLEVHLKPLLRPPEHVGSGTSIGWTHAVY